MPVVPLKQIVDRAFAERYGVPAANVVDDLTLEAVLAAAVQERSPLIVQTSVKTVRAIGADLLLEMWRARTAGLAAVPVSLHLDHCPDRDFIRPVSLRKGWTTRCCRRHIAAPVADNQRPTGDGIVAEDAGPTAAHVAG